MRLEWYALVSTVLHAIRPLTPQAASNSDYYSIVKKPIDMVIIQNKMSAGLYSKLDHIFDDLVMMLDNAFTFFPRSSQESQDAVALQRVVLKKYTDLRGKGWSVLVVQWVF